MTNVLNLNYYNLVLFHLLTLAQPLACLAYSLLFTVNYCKNYSIPDNVQSDEMSRNRALTCISRNENKSNKERKV